ncbi:unnamed protein product [Rotaria sp. Silwood2]|nr:unnamed protein product [Rotaria sp. Silwood2]CAF4062904.1 unnamed protein product [Rotaria sp. Silwood2]CAF4166853.1 unnamed protein product [Rotaria sp. Silwood2]
MDSGPFVDVIPILLSYLDFKSLVRLAQTCCFWKDRIYNDLKLWPNMIELPYIGRMDDDGFQRYDPETVVKEKLWSMVLPPDDPKALEKVLEKMASSEESVQRFQFVEKTYDGYGHSCSSFECCGSNTPNYHSTLGCQYTYHHKCADSSSNSRRSHELHDGDKWVYLVTSFSFIEQIKELTNANDDLYSISTSEYTFALEGERRVFDEEFELCHDKERLAKALRDHLNSFLTLADVELSSQGVSLQTPRLAWFQFMFMLLSRLERSDIGMQEVSDRLRIDYHSRSDIIEKFIQTYSSEKAMEWCMKDSFYFDHINRTLRSENIKDIFTHRAIICDVEQSLVSWHND